MEVHYEVRSSPALCRRPFIIAAEDESLAESLSTSFTEIPRCLLPGFCPCKHCQAVKEMAGGMFCVRGEQ